MGPLRGKENVEDQEQLGAGWWKNKEMLENEHHGHRQRPQPQTGQNGEVQLRPYVARSG